MRGDWLNPALDDKDGVQERLESIPEPHLLPRVVDRAVGNVRNDGPHLIEPVGKASADSQSLAAGRYFCFGSCQISWLILFSPSTRTVTG